MADERFALIAEWYDQQAALVRRYQLLYYPSDGTIEMFDIKNRRTFLRRTQSEGVKLTDLYIGNTLSLLSRQLTLVEFADEYTRRSLGSRAEKTCGVVLPDSVSKLGEIIDVAQSAGLSVANIRMCRLDRSEAMELCREQQQEGGGAIHQSLSAFTSGPVVAMELVGPSAVDTWRSLIGPSDPAAARRESPGSLRARFGQDAVSNAVHGSSGEAAAARELEFFFPTAGAARANTSGVAGSTCCLVKPHALADGKLGRILSAIVDQGFTVAAMATFRLDKANAEEFLEVYKGVVAEYGAMVTELTSGPCVAMEIAAGAGDAYKEFREFCGPADPEIARHLRPRSLRAKFGKDKVQNAVHCTDLPEDAQLEVQYFFQILDN